MSDLTVIPEPILGFLAQHAPAVQFEPERDTDRSLSELGLDSLDKMFLLLSVQEHYQIEFKEADIKSLRSLKDIADRVAA